ncbi:hypothetical protein ANCCEY_02775 [Ancylostoma ceylanicum]|uniref:Bestrophin homolog n=1 Tax=Ancylostoma ceylanicum TaxID=53326 RepID=A0A0D6M1H5_9BILA|nr:hypothetical protein ANCCEY_02775 [Ancylostoma ceylanicum]
MEISGFLHENEKEDLDKINIQPVYKLYWAPVNWALTLCFRAHKDGHLNAPASLNNCLNEIKIFRTNLALLCNFDWVPIPIAYPQVAEALLNPLGEDDDDFECNFLIDKNIAVSATSELRFMEL